MESPELDPQVLARIRSGVVLLLGALVIGVVVVSVAGVWPVPWVDELGVALFGSSGLRWRFAGTFLIIGGGLVLPVVVLLAVVVNALRFVRRRSADD